MKKLIGIILSFFMILALAACSASGAATSGLSSGSISGQSVASASSETAASGASTTSAAAAAGGAASASAALAENTAPDDTSGDGDYDAAAAVQIALNGDSASADNAGVTVEGGVVTITAPGDYILSGSLTDGQVVVKTVSKETVRLILNGVDIHSAASAPIYVMDAKKVVLILADGTQNTLTDGASYTFAVPADEEPNAAVFSKADLTITGGGALNVSANFQDGISTKDGLVIAGGTISVTAVDDGIRGKDYLVVKDGSITVNAGGDGLKADNAEDAALGYISIENGSLTVVSGGDAINAQTDASITGGVFNLTTNGSGDVSAKAIKGVVNVNIDGGSFTINSADDAVHSNGSITINGGDFTIVSGDDGMHADAALTINNGSIQIKQAYEGLESTAITINNGTIHVVASDDGINVASGMDGSGMGGPGGQRQDTFTTYTGSNWLRIHGGYLFVDAGGDGLDANGAIEMTDGVVLVNGPTENMNGALDYDSGFTLTGGLMVAAGSSGMAMAPAANSSQNSALVYFTSSVPAGSLVNIQNSAGESILTFAATKQIQSLAFSSAELTSGQTYTVFTGGSASGTAVDGLYSGGSYSGGTQVASFTVSGTVTQVGSGGGGMRGPRP